MTKLFTQNRKIKKSNTNQYLVFNFGIPAYKSQSGLNTCPMAGICAQGCYAQAGAYNWGNVKTAYEYRLEVSLSAEFISKASEELDKIVRRGIRESKQVVIRIHDSGDFYNVRYLSKFIKIMDKYPEITFYAYTKMVPMFNKYQQTKSLPSNFRVIYSEGGLADSRINTEVDYHSRVFSSEIELGNAGYVDASNDDLIAGLGISNKIGLIYHGAKSKTWKTGV